MTAKDNAMKKIGYNTLTEIILLITAIVVLVIVCINNHNSQPAVSLGAKFVGEYKIGDSDWQTLTSESHIPALSGEVTLRGRFEGVAPDGDNIGPLKEGWVILFVLDHIGGEMYIDGECVKVFDSENSQIGFHSCGENISEYVVSGNENNGVEIILRNPHHFGNGDAIEKFLDSMTVCSSYTEKALVTKGDFQRTIGFVVIILSLAMSGIALFSSLLHISYKEILWRTAGVLFFAGGYIVMSSPYIRLWSNHTLFNTYALQLCGIMYALFIMGIIMKLVGESRKKLCSTVLALCGVAVCIMLVLSLCGVILPYDVSAYSSVFIAITAIIMLVCCIMELVSDTALRKIIVIGAILVLVALVVDIVAMATGLWTNGMSSLAAFGLVFVIALIYALCYIPKSILRETELKDQLQDSRIAIMLSQIQPHFLYNVLNTIHYLCAKDPRTAQQAICDFSDYLRVNLDSLQRKTPVPFTTELKHVQTYMTLEKMRFDDILEIEYDIQAEDFSLPSLTIQPLAENAVKHGICQNSSGGTVRISTRETKNSFEIIVSDNGTGFDISENKNDGKSHIGIQNVRDRIERISGGTLMIESEIGKGTTAVVRIPKHKSD